MKFILVVLIPMQWLFELWDGKFTTSQLVICIATDGYYVMKCCLMTVA